MSHEVLESKLQISILNDVCYGVDTGPVLEVKEPPFALCQAKRARGTAIFAA